MSELRPFLLEFLLSLRHFRLSDRTQISEGVCLQFFGLSLFTQVLTELDVVDYFFKVLLVLSLCDVLYTFFTMIWGVFGVCDEKCLNYAILRSKVVLVQNTDCVDKHVLFTGFVLFADNSFLF